MLAPSKPDSIFNKLVAKQVPYCNQIKDVKGNVLEEYPVVEVLDVCDMKGHTCLYVVFATGPKVGETAYIDTADVIAF
jgi:hypothetical protein